MALYLLKDFLDEFEPVRPSRILNQHFGLGLTPEDLLSPLTISPSRPLLRGRYYRPWAVQTKDTGSTVKYEKDKFEVNLDVQQFKPEEITVKVVDNSVVVEGKHEEKQDEHGFISRQFTRRYVLPKDYDVKNVQSSLSSDGVLTITAPKSNAIESQERVIPITHTGPHKAVQEKETKDEKQEEKKEEK